MKNIPANRIQIGSRSSLEFSDNMDKKSSVSRLQDESVTFTFTSPPYWNFIDYADNEECVG
ncbi:hypothetical protein C6497_11935 [Candidatus Poribacteria bacterium]|nr:MAG: hypothetical protein C6497_11935 [Candidatus Poribacteria bacterium]